MEFDLFKPSRKIIEKICEDQKKLVYTYIIIPRKFADKPIEDLVRAYNPALGNFVGEFYNLGKFVKESPHLEAKLIYQFDYNSFLEVFREGITNAIAHGPENCNQINYGLFLGDKGLCQGFKGNYFKSQEIRNLWKNKVPINTTKTSYFSGEGLGKEGISNASDSIEVDTKEGILYCIQTHKNLDIVLGKFY